MERASGHGKFITLEGVDGAGKSTHVAWIAEYLQRAGRRVVLTREPGGTPIAETLRTLALAQEMDAMTETLLMFAARADHVTQVIRPALERGDWVVCDRFTDATFAYQGAGKGVSEVLIEQLGAATHAGVTPDLTLVFDCPYETSQQRLAGAQRALDRFEQEGRNFFERVRAAYAGIARRDPVRVRLIDARREIPEIRNAIEQILAGL